MALAVDRWGEGEEGHQAGRWKLCPLCRDIPLPKRSCACACRPASDDFWIAFLNPDVRSQPDGVMCGLGWSVECPLTAQLWSKPMIDSPVARTPSLFISECVFLSFERWRCCFWYCIL